MSQDFPPNHHSPNATAASLAFAMVGQMAELGQFDDALKTLSFLVSICAGILAIFVHIRNLKGKKRR